MTSTENKGENYANYIRKTFNGLTIAQVSYVEELEKPIEIFSVLPSGKVTTIESFKKKNYNKHGFKGESFFKIFLSNELTFDSKTHDHKTSQIVGRKYKITFNSENEKIIDFENGKFVIKDCVDEFEAPTTDYSWFIIGEKVSEKNESGKEGKAHFKWWSIIRMQMVYFLSSQFYGDYFCGSCIERKLAKKEEDYEDDVLINGNPVKKLKIFMLSGSRLCTNGYDRIKSGIEQAGLQKDLEAQEFLKKTDAITRSSEMYKHFHLFAYLWLFTRNSPRGEIDGKQINLPVLWKNAQYSDYYKFTPQKWQLPASVEKMEEWLNSV